MSRAVTVLLSLVLVAGCSNGDGVSTRPTAFSPQQPAATRIISVFGDLTFEAVAGQPFELRFTIRNSGNATLTVTGITVIGELAGDVPFDVGIRRRLRCHYHSGGVPDVDG